LLHLNDNIVLVVAAVAVVAVVAVGGGNDCF